MPNQSCGDCAFYGQELCALACHPYFHQLRLTTLRITTYVSFDIFSIRKFVLFGRRFTRDFKKKVQNQMRPVGQAIRYRNFLSIGAVLSLLMIMLPSQAQVSLGAISGTVQDSTSAPVVGATVKVINQDTGVSSNTTTDSRGFYSVEGLSVGRYRIDTAKAGFQENITQGIQIDPGERRASNISLNVGGVSTSVTVEANAVQVNTETSESGGTLDSKQINNLMLNGRDFQTLAIAIPGVSSAIGADSQTVTQNTYLIVNGSPVENTTQTIDGVYNMASGNLSEVNVKPIVDGISEFSVLKDSYSAKYGFAGSGQVIVETKEGTSTFHGSAWDYLRNNALDANQYFSTTTEPLRQNIYGYTLGGPLIIPKLYSTDRSKKTFFFASNQWYVITAGQISRGAVFPQALRNGNFSSSPTLDEGSTTNPLPTKTLTLDAGSQALLASEGKTNCVTGPTTLNPACFDPVAVALLNTYVPLPNNAANGFLNYENQGSIVTGEQDYQYRVDHSINQNNLLTARVLYERSLVNYPYDTWGGLPYNTITDDVTWGASNSLVRLQSNITPRLMNTIGVGETTDKTNYNLTKGGTLPAGVTYTQSFPLAPTQDRIPNISLSDGWTGNGVQSEPVTASDGEGIAFDDLSWVHGNHVIQTGAVYMFGIKRQNVFTNPQGTFTFTGVHTGDPAADYMLGLDTEYTQASTQRLGSYHYRQGEAYIQDDWKATQRLTFNMGVRSQYFSNDTVSGDEVTSFNPALYNPALAPVVNINGSLQVNSANQPLTTSGTIADTTNGLEYAGQDGTPSGFFVPKKTLFGPRVGFAYDVFGNQKTSIRGGYGIGYSRIPLEQIYNAFGQNPPYNQSSSILNSLLSNGTAGTTSAPTPETLDNVPLSFKPSELQSFSLTVEHQIVPNMIATVAYAGSVSRHLMTFQGGYDFNFPLPVTAPSTSGCLALHQAPSASYDFDPCINTGAASPNYTRPYQGYATMNNQYDEGSANYNALQSSLSYRANASQFTISYTYAKALATVGSHSSEGTTAQDTAVQNPRDFHAEYGPPSYDFTNDISGTWVYNIPIFTHSSGLEKVALGGWSFAGLALHQSGFALSPGLTTSTAGEAIRPNQIAPYRQIGSQSEWFDTSVYQAPGYGFFGDASNGRIRGPGYTSFNVSLYKTFAITHRFSTEFRAEAFNVANHPNFINVDTGLGDGSFGQLTSTGDPRIMEFALKVRY
jgi:hypothetical protein